MNRLLGSRACLQIGVLACAALGACAGNGDGLDSNGQPVGEGGSTPPGSGGTATFQQIQDTVLTPICTACHAGGSAPLGLRLDAGNSYALLVNVASVEVPSLSRVKPGDPDNSYIVQKIEGRAAVGGRMPLGGPALSQANIDLIRQWIAEGAPAPTSQAMSGAAAMASLSDAAVSSTLRVTSTVPADGELSNGPVDEVLLILNRNVDPSLVSAATVSLVASGSDGRFDSADAHSVPLASAQVPLSNPALIVLKPASPLASGAYELVLKGSGTTALASTDARVLDGDADGRPGGDFTMHFEIGTGTVR